MSQNNYNILVLGVSRGGTTLSAAALGAHPGIAMLDEDVHGGLFRVLGGKIGGVKLCVPNQMEFERRWHWIYTPGLLNGFFRKSLFMNRIPKSRLCFLDYLAEGVIQPVCVLRSAPPVISSIMKRENRTCKVASYRWQRCIEVFDTIDKFSHLNLLSPIFIKFDDLVLRPQEVLSRLCARLSLDFDEVMLEAPSRNERYRSSGFDKSKVARADSGEGVDLRHISSDVMETYDALCEKAL